ncbi:coiled-coil domain-containing protein 62 isoform X2 [Ahaetulla prasina]|uniref:coiled-coil domain-containing protein 62 isoform X2 n=1 Tax=Ahaetulla prasina TaxID=499056 RepID=UPI0026474C8D|nr:coiled-coil domain-containing protein 62 isoform X2 [Ahaetulla prasina]
MGGGSGSRCWGPGTPVWRSGCLLVCVSSISRVGTCVGVWQVGWSDHRNPMNSALGISSPFQNLASKSEIDLIQKLKKELQLVLAELKDRDKELNNMVAVHQRQFLAWEDDRQKILTLEERSSRLENELHKRNEMITTLTQRLKLLGSLQNDCSSTLENTQQKLQELSRKASDTSLQCQTLEEKNQTLVGSVLDLSHQVGQLQAREQELLTLLRLKDDDILEATNQITEFTSKFKKLESALCACKIQERSFNEEKQNFKLRMKEAMLEANRLKGDLNEKIKENSAQREEIIQLKQENAYLSNELMLTAERESRKVQLLLSAKSKQLRTDTELNNLRQIYLKQQQDLQFLHFHLESSQEKHRTESQDGSPGMVLSDLETSGNQDSLCGEVGREIPTHFVHLPDCPLKKAGHICQAQKRQQEQRTEHVHEGPFRHSRHVRQEEGMLSIPRNAGEVEDRSAARLDNPQKSRSKQTVWMSEPGTVTSLPRHKSWFEANFCAGTSGCLAPRFFDKASGDCKDAPLDPGRIPPRQRPCVPPPPGNPACELGCSACSAIRQASLYRSDQEWAEMLKPVENDGSGLWGGESSPRPPDAPELKSDQDGSLNGFDWDGPCFTSTQRSKGTTPLEIPSASDHPSGLQGPTRCNQLPTHRDSRSPDDKLQQMLAETRQMVTHLEHSHLLSASPRYSPTGSPHTTGDGPKSVCELEDPVEEESGTKLSPFASQERKPPS